MWLLLGDTEIINLRHVSSVKKGADNLIEIYFEDFNHYRILPFPSEETRNAAFERLVRGLKDGDKVLE